MAAASLAGCASYRDIGAVPGETLIHRMPVEEHVGPAAGPVKTFVILYSGDGGSRGGNREISRELAALGVPVVDVDSLGYFWTKRSIQADAQDLVALIAHYSELWHAPHVVLAGYSFGGSALPGIAMRLPPELRARIPAVVLIAPRDYVEMTLRPHSWINIRPPHPKPLLPDLEAIAWARRVCVYGETDTLAACPRLPPGVAEVHKLPGGHKFGGDYSGVAAVLDAEATRAP